MNNIPSTTPTATSSFRLTSQVLQEHPSLMLPPFLLIILSSVLVGTGSLRAQFGTLVSLSLLNLAVTGGWYKLIVLAVAQKKLHWDDFLTGIGQHFWQLLLGSLVFFSTLGLASAPFIFGGIKWAGNPRALPLENIQKHLLAGKIELIAPEHLLVLSKWMIIFCIIGALYGIMSYFLLLWNQAIVVREESWLNAWRTSFHLTTSAWKPICAILVVNAFAWFIAITFRVMPLGPIALLLSSLASLVAEIYFRIAFTVFVSQKYPLPEEPPKTALA